MFQGFKNGWPIIKESFQIFGKHPQLITPLFFTWCLYAPIVIYMQYGFKTDGLSFGLLLSILIGLIFTFVFLLTFSCSILMELIRQIEFGEELSFLVALKDSFGRNLVALLPLMALWTFLWLIIVLIEGIICRFRGGRDKELNSENVAKTLGGWDVFSWPRLLFYYFEKALRMIMFLIVPSIVWHEPNFFKSLKEVMGIFKKHTPEFIAGFILTEAASTLVFLPPSLLFAFSRLIKFPDFVWILCIIYISLAWSYSMYLEQMYTAQLYLWHRKWYKEMLISKELGKPVSNLRDIPKPSLLDDFNDLKI
jgi:hypothetical protein